MRKSSKAYIALALWPVGVVCPAKDGRETNEVNVSDISNVHGTECVYAVGAGEEAKAVDSPCC